MKLYITLDNEKGNKIERVIDMSEIDNGNGGYGYSVDGIFESMRHSMQEVEKENADEEIEVEAKRLIHEDKAHD